MRAKQRRALLGMEWMEAAPAGYNTTWLRKEIADSGLGLMPRLGSWQRRLWRTWTRGVRPPSGLATKEVTSWLIARRW